jgi:hypothetical protein
VLTLPGSRRFASASEARAAARSREATCSGSDILFTARNDQGTLSVSSAFIIIIKTISVRATFSS